MPPSSAVCAELVQLVARHCLTAACHVDESPDRSRSTPARLLPVRPHCSPRTSARAACLRDELVHAEFRLRCWNFRRRPMRTPCWLRCMLCSRSSAHARCALFWRIEWMLHPDVVENVVCIGMVEPPERLWRCTYDRAMLGAFGWRESSSAFMPHLALDVLHCLNYFPVYEAGGMVMALELIGASPIGLLRTVVVPMRCVLARMIAHAKMQRARES